MNKPIYGVTVGTGLNPQPLTEQVAKNTKDIENIVVPTKTSDLENDSDFQTGEQVRAEIGKMTHFTFEKVDSVESVVKENVIYLVPNVENKEDNVFDEYLLVDGTPELIGSTAIDLSGYALKEDIPTVPSSLPNPNALTFTGAVEGTYDGSEPLSVKIPSGGSSNNGLDSELICDILTSEPVVFMAQDVDNKRYRKLLVYVTFQGKLGEMNPDNITAGFRQRIKITFADGNSIEQGIYFSFVGYKNDTPLWHVHFSVELADNVATISIMRTEAKRNSLAAIKENAPLYMFDIGKYNGITQIKFGAENDKNLLMTTGATMRVYGIY